jgi:hypothetical protein
MTPTICSTTHFIESAMMFRMWTPQQLMNIEPTTNCFVIILRFTVNFPRYSQIVPHLAKDHPTTLFIKIREIITKLIDQNRCSISIIIHH